MSNVTIVEKCSCGASISVTGSQHRRDSDARNPRGAEETVERWREQHDHKEPEAPSANKEESRRQMAERAWNEGFAAAVCHIVELRAGARADEFTGNPYERSEQA